MTRIIGAPRATREEVYVALDSERAYQDKRWTVGTTSSEGEHETVTEWLVYMRDYVEEALHIMSREGEPECTEKALNIVRKVGGLAVSCMEQLGAPRREGY